MSKMFTLTSIKTNSWLHTAHSDYTEEAERFGNDLRHGICTTLIFQHAKSRQEIIDFNCMCPSIS